MSTATTPSSNTRASALATLQAVSTTPSLFPRSSAGPCAAPPFPPLSVMASPAPLPAQRSADLAERLDDFRPARLRPVVPVGPHGLDRLGDLLGLGLGEDVAGIEQRLLRRRLLDLHRLLIP